MRRTEALQGVRMIRFRSVLGRYEADGIEPVEAAELLGVSERTFRRWCQRFEDGRRGGPVGSPAWQGSGKRVPVDREEEVETSVSDALQRFHRTAFPRAPGAATTGSPGATPGRRPSCNRRACWNGAATRRASAQTATPAVAGNDAASGRFTPRVAGGSGGDGPDRDNG